MHVRTIFINSIKLRDIMLYSLFKVPATINVL
nr:MAG TPA: hypothetical protein [Caudoviricetes sp.]